MSTKFEESWKRWLASKEGQESRNYRSLTTCQVPQSVYLENRLHRAYSAGWRDRIAPVEVGQGSSFEGAFSGLCALLDAIEAAVREEDFARVGQLVRGRFIVVEEHGFKVMSQGLPASGHRN